MAPADSSMGMLKRGEPPASGSPVYANDIAATSPMGVLPTAVFL